MIERPKRAVTRFFIPLIDVLILLFCIFLLMPFMDAPTAADGGETEKVLLTREEMRQEIDRLRLDLDQTKRELKKSEDRQGDPTERLSILVLDIDPKDGNLFYYSNGKHLAIPDQRAAQEVIDEHKRHAGLAREPFFIILLPRVENPSFPSLAQLRTYHQWFKSVSHRFDSPLNILPPEFEERPK